MAMSFSPPRPARGAGGPRCRPFVRAPASPGPAAAARPVRPTLRLEQFQAVPVLDFGSAAAPGEARALDLEVVNPRGEPQELAVDRLAVGKGLTWEGPPLPLAVPPHESVVVRLAWRPRRPGPFSESVLFKWGDRHRLQVRALGEAAGDWAPPAPEEASWRPAALRSRLPGGTSARRGSPAKRRGGSSAGSSAVGTRGSRVAPQPKVLKLKRVGGASAAARARSAAAAAASAGGPVPGPLRRGAPLGGRVRGEHRRGSSPDAGGVPDSFAEHHVALSLARRETALQAWYNHRVGQPGRGGEAAGPGAGAGSASAFDAGLDSPGPSLQARHAASKVSGLLWQLYSGKDPRMVEAMLRVERLIDAGQLRLREDNSLLGDVRLQERAWRVLGSYHPWWLRLAFETVTGYAARGDTLPDLELLGGLQRFFLDEFLACPAVSKQFARNAAVDGLHLPGYQEALGRAVLKRFLLLAMLLDRAAAQCQEQRGRHPVEADGLPPLFHPRAEHTSSEALVVAFLAGNLRGEGDVLRHLRFHDYALTYRQPAFVKFDFRAQNPASDFRDGARLCWLADALVPGSRTMAQAKMPAPAPAARAHNLDLALKALQVKFRGRPEFEGVISADEIQRGDRERTLELLWRAFAAWELPRLVPESDLRLEVSRLRALADPAAGPCAAASLASCGIERLDLLLQWMHLVGALTSPGGLARAPGDGNCGGLPLNFDSSLSDGRLLCQLVAFYAPGYLDGARICGRTPGSAAAATLFEGAGRNFDLLRAAARALGGIPEGCVAPPRDLETHGVDRRAGAILVAHLAHRLLGAARGDRAAMRIQRAWRSALRAPAPETAPSPGEAERRATRRREAERAAERRVELAERVAARKAAAAEQAAAEREQAAERKAAALELRAEERAVRAEREASQKAEETERAAAERVKAAERRAAGKVREAERMAAEKAAAAARAEARATAAAEQAAARDAQAAEEAGREAVEAARRRAAAAVVCLAGDRRPAERAAEASRRAEEAERTARETVAAAERMVEERARAAEQAALEKAAAAERRAAAAEAEARRRAAEVERRAEEKVLAAEKEAARRAAAAEEAAFQRAAESERRAAARAAEADRMAAEIEAESERMAQEMAAAAESVAAEKAARVEALKVEAQAAQAAREAKALEAAKFQAKAERAASLERRRQDAAAAVVQAHFRGMLVRRRLRAAAAARLWREQEEDAAARAIQGAFAACAERKSFVKLRHAAVRLQARARGNEARRSLQAMQLVATAIQTAVRGWIARRALARARGAALRVQAAWRGCMARRGSRSSPLREARRRRLVAEAGANMGPGSPAARTLEAQAGVAVARLLRAQRREEEHSDSSGRPGAPSAVCEAAAALEFSTRYSRECCRLLARSPGALAGLLRLLRGCDARSEQGLELQRAALGVLENVCRCGGLAARVREVPGACEVLAEQLQLWRGLEAAFVPAARVLALLCRGSAGEAGAGLDEADLRRVRNVSVLLAQKRRAESSCLAHLSGNLPAGAAGPAGAAKGPGASRRGARLRALEAQLGALAEVTDALEAPLRALRAAEVRGPGL